MKKIITIIALFGFVFSLAQKSYKNQIPKNWKIISETKGDLNKDNISDIAVIVEEKDMSKKLQNDRLGPKVLNLQSRGIMIFFADKNGNYILADKNLKGFIPTENDEDNPCLENPLDEKDGIKIEKNILKIHYNYFLTCGSYETSNDDYKFRFQNGGFELIGLDSYSFSRSTGEASKTSRNYSTRKEISTTGLNEFSESKPTTTTTNIKIDKLLKLRDLESDIVN